MFAKQQLFDRLKLDDRDALNKVELLDLDLGLDYFSTSVASAVTMVIHCALLTDGDHPMRTCVDTNIKFTMALMHLAYSCTNLEVRSGSLSSTSRYFLKVVRMLK